jgi:hypothetical protein
MNTTPEHLQRIDTVRHIDPTAPRQRLSAVELDETLREQREHHVRSVDDALRFWHARPHRRASDNDSGIPAAERARAIARRKEYHRRLHRVDVGWWSCIIVLGGYVLAVGAYHLGRYGW